MLWLVDNFYVYSSPLLFFFFFPWKNHTIYKYHAIWSRQDLAHYLLFLYQIKPKFPVQALAKEDDGVVHATIKHPSMKVAYGPVYLFLLHSPSPVNEFLPFCFHGAEQKAISKRKACNDNESRKDTLNFPFFLWVERAPHLYHPPIFLPHHTRVNTFTPPFHFSPVPVPNLEVKLKQKALLKVI